jgi:LuxR family maltose regulon positive regulatory protein
VLLAQVHHKLGEDKAVRSLLAEARDIMASLPDAGRFPMLFEKLESQLDAEIQFSTAQKPISTETVSGQDDLTERELDVLKLLIDTHFSQREIGERLYISTNTVKSHVRAIYRKLQTTTREEAAAIARRQGLF